MENVVNVGVVKCGNIGAAPLFELLIDELADRKDVSVRVASSGAKMSVEDVVDVVTKILQYRLDILIFISPNPATPGPSKAVEMLAGKGVHTVFVCDSPGKRVKPEFEKKGFGYIIILGDPLIGARKEFLDPLEMALFNSNIIKVLAGTGVFRIAHRAIDKIIHAVKSGKPVRPPQLIIDTDMIRDGSDFQNPYAKAKAMAAYELAKKVAEINVKACFVEQKMEKYVPLVACSHEVAQAAARLVEEAREIEKYGDSVIRRPHSKRGKPKVKRGLMLPPEVDEETISEWGENRE